MRTLDSIVKQYIGESGKIGLHKYQLYLQYAINGLRELNFDVDGVDKEVLLTLGNTNVAYVPNDLVSINKVFMLGANGHQQEVYEDNTLNSRLTDDCGDDVRVGNDKSVGEYPYTAEELTEHTSDGEWIGRQFGLGGGSSYGYRYNREQGRLEFTSNINSPLILQYIGDPQRLDGKLVVNDMAVEALLLWIRYSELRFKNKVALGEKQIAKDSFFSAKQHYMLRVRSRSQGSIENNSRKTFKQSPRY